jgi:hypothetical protein
VFSKIHVCDEGIEWWLSWFVFKFKIGFASLPYHPNIIFVCCLGISYCISDKMKFLHTVSFISYFCFVYLLYKLIMCIFDIQLFQLRLSTSKAEKSNMSAKGCRESLWKFINLLTIPSSLSRSYSTFPLCSWTTLIEIAVCLGLLCRTYTSTNKILPWTFRYYKTRPTFV